MHTSGTRILIVEDSELFRRFIVSTLQLGGNFQITEASNGVEALQRAEELLPDLALLDIGLPDIDGIEIARRLQRLAIPPKIVFVSQECSPDILGEVLSVGALGYVHKMHASRDLLAAVKSVLAGKRFVSSGLKCHGIGDAGYARATHRHEVQFYSDDAAFLENLTQFVAAALKRGDAAIVFATKPHRDGLLQGLDAEHVDVYRAVREGTYIPLDAAETLNLFMVDGWPDAARFSQGFGKLTESALKAVSRTSPRVAIFGEAVALLLEQRKIDAAIRLEQLGNVLAKASEVDILCAYPFSVFRGDQDKQAFSDICAEHSAVQCS